MRSAFRSCHSSSESASCSSTAKSTLGWFLTFAGVIIIFTGVLMNLHIYFQPTSLFNTVAMIVLLAGGLGLIARGIATHRS